MASLADRIPWKRRCERLRDLDEPRDLRQPVARDNEAEAVAAVAQHRRVALVREPVIDAASGPPLLSLLDEGVRREIDAPAERGGRLGERARRRGIERGAGGILGEPLDEAFGPAVGREADGGLARLAFLEEADAPGVGGVQAVAQHRGERALAAALELDERLHVLVECERRGLSRLVRAEPVAADDFARGRERAGAIHPQVEREDREGVREVPRRGRPTRDRDGDEEEPEGRTFHARSLLRSTRRDGGILSRAAYSGAIKA
jgi:hypothetical protein